MGREANWRETYAGFEAKGGIMKLPSSNLAAAMEFFLPRLAPIVGLSLLLFSSTVAQAQYTGPVKVECYDEKTREKVPCPDGSVNHPADPEPTTEEIISHLKPLPPDEPEEPGPDADEVVGHLKPVPPQQPKEPGPDTDEIVRHLKPLPADEPEELGPDADEIVSHLKKPTAGEPSDLNKPFDPRKLVTVKEYEYAKLCQERLQNLERLLKAKRLELRGWRGDLNRYNQEFETLRAETAEVSLSEILAAIPFSETVAEMSKYERYQRYLTPRRVDQLKSAYTALKSIVSGGEVLSAKTDVDRLRKALEAANGVRETLTGLAVAGLPPADEGRIWVERTGKTLKIFAASLLFLIEQSKGTQNGSFLEKIEPGLTLGAGVYGIMYNPWVGPAIAAEGIAFKRTRTLIIRRATDDLDGALSKNWSADRYLDTKLVSIKEDLAAVQETIGKYESVHN